MTPDQLGSHGYAEFAELEEAFALRLKENPQSAAGMIYPLDLKQPDLKNLLRSKEIGDTVLVASLLIQHATRYPVRIGRSAARGGGLRGGVGPGIRCSFFRENGKHMEWGIARGWDTGVPHS
jgi:hypothetical protein